RTCCSAVPFGGVCFIGFILVPFTVTMSRKLSSTQTTQTVLWALTANNWRSFCRGGRPAGTNFVERPNYSLENAPARRFV
ncbi:MAG: hypothetical protein ACK5X0_10410, partial [Rhodospirillales bacterium]